MKPKHNWINKVFLNLASNVHKQNSVNFLERNCFGELLSIKREEGKIIQLGV